MTIIEGIGDEVLAVIIGTLLFVTLLLSLTGVQSTQDLSGFFDSLWSGQFLPSTFSIFTPAAATQQVTEEVASTPPETPESSTQQEFVRSQRVEFFSQPPESATESTITLRLKYLNDTERTVQGNPDRPIIQFKRQHFSPELESQHIVKLIYHGRLLQDDHTLRDYGITTDNCVVHVQVSQPVASAPPSSSTQATQDPDLSRLMWPLLAVMLVTLWLFRLRFKEYFDLTSTLILVTFTFVFLSALLGSRFHHHP